MLWPHEDSYDLNIMDMFDLILSTAVFKNGQQLPQPMKGDLLCN